MASTLLGPEAMNGGTRTVLFGLLMHLGVAFGWSTVFLGLWTQVAAIRRVVASPAGPLKVAALYGPIIWMVMSLLIIPQLVDRPPSITWRWWVQFFGHIPFVALPIVIGIAGRAPRPEEVRR